MPTISIGLPVYNGGDHLEACLQSILAQSFQDFELFISDNASTDRTRQICEHFARQDRRIKYFRQPENIGAASNFRFVFENTSAPLFKWMAHDDWIDSDWLERLVPVATKEQAIVFGHLQMVTYEGDLMAHQGNGRTMEYTGAPLWRQLAYAIEPANLGKANVIYGIFPRTVITNKSFDIFSGYGAPGDVIMLTDCLGRVPVISVGSSRLYKRAAPSRPQGTPTERRPSIFERTMVNQFMKLDPSSFKIGYLVLYPITLLRMKFERKLRRWAARISSMRHSRT